MELIVSVHIEIRFPKHKNTVSQIQKYLQLLPPTTRSLLTALMIAGFPRAHCLRMHSETP